MTTPDKPTPVPPAQKLWTAQSVQALAIHNYPRPEDWQRIADAYNAALPKQEERERSEPGDTERLDWRNATDIPFSVNCAKSDYFLCLDLSGLPHVFIYDFSEKYFTSGGGDKQSIKSWFPLRAAIDSAMKAERETSGVKDG